MSAINSHNATTESRSPAEQAAAVDLVRARLDTLYGVFRHQGLDDPPPSRGGHLINEFWQRHHNHPQPHEAWNSYYVQLSADDKNHLWQEYHLRTGPLSGVAWNAPSLTISQLEVASLKAPEISSSRSRRLHRQTKPMSLRRRFFVAHVKPIVSAALIVAVAWFIFYNPLVVARIKLYISPGSMLASPVIIDPQAAVEPIPRVIIPKINVDVPAVYGVMSYDETAIQEALEFGVVHYATTALPGQIGNAVYVGHSSNNLFNAGQYKFAFLQLNKLELGDVFYLNFESVRYVYKVTAKAKVLPNDFTYIQPTVVPSATLITCDPPGTNWKRMIIQGQQINPDPASAVSVGTTTIDAGEDTIVPGNSPSLWSRFWNWLF